MRAEYAASIERVRPIFVATGCAQALRDAGRWHAPSVEEWDSIEKAIDAEEVAGAEAARRQKAAARRGAATRNTDDASDDDDSADGGSEDGSDGGNSSNGQ